MVMLQDCACGIRPQCQPFHAKALVSQVEEAHRYLPSCRRLNSWAVHYFFISSAWHCPAAAAAVAEMLLLSEEVNVCLLRWPLLHRPHLPLPARQAAWLRGAGMAVAQQWRL